MGQTDRVVMIGTASKGIIERQHQHNAQVKYLLFFSVISRESLIYFFLGSFSSTDIIGADF